MAMFGTLMLPLYLQEVIEKTNLYPNWKYYYTNVKRQQGNAKIASFEESLGQKISTNYLMVNFWMAAKPTSSSEHWVRHGAFSSTA